MGIQQHESPDVWCVVQEYLPGARTVAVNELATVHYLMGGALPAQKWAAATAPVTQLPVVPLLGDLMLLPLLLTLVSSARHLAA